MATQRKQVDRGDTLPISRRTAVAASAEATFSLLIYHREGVNVVPLDAGVSLTVGRGEPAQVVVQDRSLSRCHARFTKQSGLEVLVEDLGSTNGTMHRGEPIERALIRPGDTVELGAVVVSPHMRAPVEPELAGLSSHDAFHTALETELARARYFGDAVAVLQLEPFDADDPHGHVSHWWRHLRAGLRPVDSAALYSPRSVELTLVRLAPTEARAHAEALLALAPRTVPLGCGIATYPESGTTADELLEACRRATRDASRQKPVVSCEPVRAPLSQVEPTSGPVVESPAMQELFAMVDRLAAARLPVLLIGETGSGKEVIARAIHERSPRAERSMVCVNCGAIPDTLVESTLFGHQKGAFTGADETSRGVFGSADGGTVLLDEVGELSAGAQAALLRVLEQGAVRPVGAANEVQLDVRVIAATHRDLEAMCEDGSFRRDLFHRLDAFTLVVPPLRERPKDIEPLARHFLADAASGGAPAGLSVSAEVLDVIRRYPWPGNVRELRNAIERAAVIARGEVIGVDDLPKRVRDACGAHATVAAPVVAADEATVDVLAGEGGLRERLRRYEEQLIRAALDRTDGNQTEAARLLQLPVRTLADKIRRLGISLPKKGEG